MKITIFDEEPGALPGFPEARFFAGIESRDPH
jgi:hypothetical protein